MRNSVFAKALRFLLVLTFMVFYSCSNDKKESEAKENKTSYANNMPGVLTPIQEMRQKINHLEDTLFKEEKLDFKKGRRAIQLYILFVDNFPADSLSPDYLFKAAEIADNIGSFEQSITLYNNCYLKYKHFIFRPECIFRQGNIYQLKLNDISKAREMYQQVIDEFPNSPMAAQSKAALSTMGKSDIELIREFEKKNGVKR